MLDIDVASRQNGRTSDASPAFPPKPPPLVDLSAGIESALFFGGSSRLYWLTMTTKIEWCIAKAWLMLRCMIKAWRYPLLRCLSRSAKHVFADAILAGRRDLLLTQPVLEP
jgi:hypothetical protein